MNSITNWHTITLTDKNASNACRKIASASRSYRQWRKSPSGRMHRLSSSLISSFTQDPLRATPRFDRSSPSNVRVQIWLMEHKLALPQKNSANTETRVEKTRNDGFNRSPSEGARRVSDDSRVYSGKPSTDYSKVSPKKDSSGWMRSLDKLVEKLEKWSNTPNAFVAKLPLNIAAIKFQIKIILKFILFLYK